MSIKNLSKKELLTIIKRRGLTREFKTYSKVLGIRNKRTIESVVPQFDGTSKRVKLFVVREHKRTKFLDFKTLKVLGTSRRSIKDAIKALSKTKIEKGSDMFRFNNFSRAVSFNIKGKGITLRSESRYSSYNQQMKRERTLVATNRPGHKYGFAVIDVTIKSKANESVRIQARSNSSFLGNRDARYKAIMSAVSNAGAVAHFTPVDYTIHYVYFEYVIEKYNRVR
jgi:hypothetical protein